MKNKVVLLGVFFVLVLNSCSCTETNASIIDPPVETYDYTADSLASFKHHGLVLDENVADSMYLGRLLFAEDQAFILSLNGSIYHSKEPFTRWEELNIEELEGEGYDFNYKSPYLYVCNKLPGKLYRTKLNDLNSWEDITHDPGYGLNAVNEVGFDSSGNLLSNVTRSQADGVDNNVYRMNLETLKWEAYGAGVLDDVHQGVVEFFTAPNGDLYFLTNGFGIFMREEGDDDWKQLNYGYNFNQYGLRLNEIKQFRGIYRREDSLFTFSISGDFIYSPDKYFQKQNNFASSMQGERIYELPDRVHSTEMYENHFFVGGGRSNYGPHMYSGELEKWIPLGNSLSCNVKTGWNNDCGGYVVGLKVYKDHLYALADKALLRMPLSDTVFWVDSAKNNPEQYERNYYYLHTIYPGSGIEDSNKWPSRTYDLNPELEKYRLPMKNTDYP